MWIVCAICKNPHFEYYCISHYKCFCEKCFLEHNKIFHGKKIKQNNTENIIETRKELKKKKKNKIYNCFFCKRKITLECEKEEKHILKIYYCERCILNGKLLALKEEIRGYKYEQNREYY